MNHLIFEYLSCQDLIDVFGEKKLEERYDSVYQAACKFIEANNFSDIAYVNKSILANVIIDYFNDIKRIKSFHKKIDKVNSQKVMAYLSYWFLRRKPIQIKDPNAEVKKVSIINEQFIIDYIFSYLSVRVRKDDLILRKEDGLKNFTQSMLYYLIYRIKDPQSLEMIITSFLAGQIYENIEEDISGQLHPYDMKKADTNS